MAFNANLGTQTFKESTGIDYSHPPVVLSFPVAMGQGELEAGTVVAFNEAGAIVPYNPEGEAPVNDPIGILAVRVDTNNEDVAPVLVHGCWKRESAKVGGNLIDDNTVALLRKKGVFIK